ncbi:MAG: D-sedoheptulose 7-phosphate isomerase [Deltaproteobacteria bacterium]|nr:D-sedoheptulose 7-phosphate isomerase [Deltaproteobacteria bacterium]
MKDIIEDIVQESVRVKEQFVKESYNDLITLARKIASAFTSDRKLMLCGNGGSAADAQHIAAEFVNRLEMERPPLPAISLATDSSIITCIGNDYSFNDIFTKQVKAIGLEGDVLLAISTSGNSQNVISAAEAASEMGIYVAALTGCNGGKLKDVSDLSLIVPSERTARIQESHILAGHIICKLVDHILFQGGM